MISEFISSDSKGKITDKLYIEDTALYIVESEVNYRKEIIGYTAFIIISLILLFVLSSFF